MVKFKLPSTVCLSFVTITLWSAVVLTFDKFQEVRCSLSHFQLLSLVPVLMQLPWKCLRVLICEVFWAVLGHFKVFLLGLHPQLFYLCPHVVPPDHNWILFNDEVALFIMCLGLGVSWGLDTVSKIAVSALCRK